MQDPRINSSSQQIISSSNSMDISSQMKVELRIEDEIQEFILHTSLI